MKAKKKKKRGPQSAVAEAMRKRFATVNTSMGNKEVRRAGDFRNHWKNEEHCHEQCEG